MSLLSSWFDRRALDFFFGRCATQLLIPFTSGLLFISWALDSVMGSLDVYLGLSRRGSLSTARRGHFGPKFRVPLVISFRNPSLAFITSKMATSASAFDHEGEVTPAEVERAADEYYWYLDSLALYSSGGL